LNDLFSEIFGWGKDGKLDWKSFVDEKGKKLREKVKQIRMRKLSTNLNGLSFVSNVLLKRQR
jgi:hypothetical protein